MTDGVQESRIRAWSGDVREALPVLVPVALLLVVVLGVLVGWQRQQADARRLLDGFRPSAAWASVPVDGGSDTVARGYRGPVPADPAALTARIADQASADGLLGARDPAQVWRLTRSGPTGAEVLTWTAEFVDRSSLAQRVLRVTLRVHPDHADLTAVMLFLWAGR